MTLELPYRNLQVLNLEHGQNRGGTPVAGKKEEGSTRHLDGGYTRAHAGKIPNLLSAKDLRGVIEVLRDLRASLVEKTQNAKRSVGRIAGGSELGCKVVGH